jgi:hypothetical protein
MNAFQTLSASALVLALIGCGGSTSDTTASVAAVPTVAAMQGIWQSAAGAASSTSAIALPDGTLWTVLVSTSGTVLQKSSVTSQTTGFAATGKAYTLGSTTVQSITSTVSFVEKTSLSGTVTRASQPEAFALTYQSRYDTPAVLADLAGTWTVTLGPGVTTWTVGSTGAFTGSRTTGCTYAGQFSLRSEQKAVMDVAVTETCATVVTKLSGVATLSGDKANLATVMTTTADAAGFVAGFARSK